MGNRSGAVSQAAVGLQGDISSDLSNFTTEAASLTDRILIDSGNPNKSYDPIQEEALTGNVGRGTPVNGLAETTDSVEGKMPYTYKDTNFISSDMILAAAMGGNTSYSDTDTPFYNQLTISDLEIYALTLGYIYGTANSGVEKYMTGAVPESVEISCSLDGKLTISADFVGYDVVTNDINTSTANYSIDSIPNIGHTNALGQQMVFQIGEVSSGSVAQYKVSEFTLSYERQLDTDTYATPDGSNHTDSQSIVAPVVDGRRDVSLDFEIPRYESTQFEMWDENSTELCGTIKISVGSETYKKIIMPNIYIENADVPLDGPDSITQSVSAILGRNENLGSSIEEVTFTDGGTGTAVQNEFGVELVDDRTATIL